MVNTVHIILASEMMLTSDNFQQKLNTELSEFLVQKVADDVKDKYA